MAVPTLSLASFYRRTGTLRPRHEGRETRTGHRGNKLKRKAPKVCLFADLYRMGGGGRHQCLKSPTISRNHCEHMATNVLVSVQNIFFGGQEIAKSLRSVSFCTFYLTLTCLAITADASNCSHQIKKDSNIVKEIFFLDFLVGITSRDMNDTYNVHYKTDVRT